MSLSSTVAPLKRAATAPLLRASLGSAPSNGHTAFIPQCRKLVFEYCDRWPSSANARTYLVNHLEELARANPHVEVVVKQRNQKQPIVRGFYGACLHELFGGYLGC
jgi:large subunit ribosomal protein L43